MFYEGIYDFVCGVVNVKVEVLSVLVLHRCQQFHKVTTQDRISLLIRSQKVK